MQRVSYFLVLILVTSVGSLRAQGGGRGGPQAPPNITGTWTGTWSAFNPAQATTPPREQCKAVNADVVKNDAVWEATFEGDCGRPYKYTIKMEGRQVGRVVMFKGTVDLGERDGGVFDWIAARPTPNSWASSAGSRASSIAPQNNLSPFPRVGRHGDREAFGRPQMRTPGRVSARLTLFGQDRRSAAVVTLR
jgi:hypothetical protein